MGATALRLSMSTSTVHIVFRKPTHGYFSVLSEPNLVLTKLKNADVIIIDEMSLTTTNMLCTMRQRLKQNTRTHGHIFIPKQDFAFSWDLTQLLAICIHTPKVPDVICRACHITSAPYWVAAK